MATSKRVVSVSVKRPKRDRAQKIRTALNESTIAREYRKVRPHDDDCITLCPDDPAGCKIGHSCWCGDEAPPVTDGIGVVRLDPGLLDMLRGYVETIRKVYPDVWGVPSWDAPWECIPPGIPGLEVALLRDVKLAAEFCHAIGGIAGAAAMMDLTPCMLIDNLRL